MAAKKRGAAKGNKPYKRANPQREAKTRMYRSRARSEVWTAMFMTSPLTHAQLAEKLGQVLESRFHAIEPGTELVIAECVVERVHPLQVLDRLEHLRALAADCLRRGLAADQLRVLLLEVNV